MMHRFAPYDYAAALGWQIVGLPYRGNRLTLYVLLPPKTLSLANAAREMNSTLFERLLDRTRPEKVNLSLPKFHVEYARPITRYLAEMGMAPAFDPGADFSEMTLKTYGAYVRQVAVAAAMSVDEQGTSATSIAAIEVRAEKVTVLPRNSANVTVNRPFLVAIGEKPTNQIVFLGAVADP